MSASDAVILGGVCVTATGLWMASPPIATIFVGLFAMMAGLVLARREAMTKTKPGGKHGSGQFTVGDARRGQ